MLVVGSHTNDKHNYTQYHTKLGTETHVVFVALHLFTKDKLFKIFKNELTKPFILPFVHFQWKFQKFNSTENYLLHNELKIPQSEELYFIVKYFQVKNFCGLSIPMKYFNDGNIAF